MKHIRIGNDISFKWSFYTGQGETRQPYDLTGRELLLTLTDSFGGETHPEFEIEGNKMLFSFLGKEQVYEGAYTLTAQENKGTTGMRSIDKISPFCLVEKQETVSKDCGVPESPDIEMEVVELSSTINPTNDYDTLIHKPKINGVTLQGDKTAADLGLEDRHPYTSLERKGKYLYEVTFDRLPEDNGGESPVGGGCSSYVAGGKLYTNLDWDYDNTASFIVKTRDFEGQSFIGGLNDGQMDDALIAQLPYRVHRGVNNYGIKVASHILFNDWSWTGCGERSISLTRLPFLVLTRVKSMATISQDLGGILGNLYAPDGLKALDYLLQILVTDGTTTYALMPPTSEGQGYVLQNITANPKLANFRWVNKAEVTRGELQDRPTGVERWNMMPCPLENLRFTKAYEQPTRLSEFIGLRGTTKDSTDAELEAIYADARAEYLRRERDGKTWQTMESAVYGDRLEALYIQEDWSKNLIPATTEYVDKVAHGLEEAIEDEVERATEAETTLQENIDAEVARATAKEGELATAIQQETTRAQVAEGALSEGLEAETERATAKEAELEAEIAQQGKVDDVEVDDISVVEGKIAKIYTRIKGFGIGGILHLELSHFLNTDNGKINVTNPYAHFDETNHKIYI